MSKQARLAFVFDLDGVIVDSNPIHELAWREYLRTAGTEAPENFERWMYGRRNDDIVRDLFGSHLSETDVRRHGADKEALYRDLMKPVLKDRLVPGLLDFLDYHRADPLAVASNAEKKNLDFILDSTCLRGYFRVAISGEQASRPKPDPEIYLLTAERLGVKPENCIVFEDSDAGVAAARSAGTRVVGLSTTHSDLPGVDLIVPNFLDAKLETWLRVQTA